VNGTAETVPEALATLEKLLALPSADLGIALSHASDVIAEAVGADKVDAFLHDPSRDSLVAVGTSSQPLSVRQRKLGLDVLPVANGGLAVRVFQTGEVLLSGKIDADVDEVPGVRQALGIRSQIGVPLDVGNVRRGMLMIASQQPDRFTEREARFVEGVARWIGIIVHRAELVEEIARNAVEQGRRAVAEELVTVLAHDLRNFISPIAMRLTLVRRRAEHDRREQDTRDLELACHGIGRLQRMISDMLDVARIDQGVFQMEITAVDAGALLQDIASPLGTPDNPVLVRVVEPVLLAADPQRLGQCLENLISNAVRHSPHGAPVTVLLSRHQEMDREVGRIEVLDEGPGIPPELRQRIFERFVTGQRGAGLGLGLYLAHRIAVMHDGDLAVQSPPAKGTRFTLTLPCYTEH
jgi:two-component system OmpR family sensor kinase